MIAGRLIEQLKATATKRFATATHAHAANGKPQADFLRLRLGLS
jgi:hypothetical protein